MLHQPLQLVLLHDGFVVLHQMQKKRRKKKDIRKNFVTRTHNRTLTFEGEKKDLLLSDY
jgi:hypothetical protein